MGKINSPIAHHHFLRGIGRGHGLYGRALWSLTDYMPKLGQQIIEYEVREMRYALELEGNRLQVRRLRV